jgi:hypothetical protein
MKMKLIEKDTNRVSDIHMFIVYYDERQTSGDIADDFFDGVEVVADIDYCIDQAKDWVYGRCDYDENDPCEMRIAIIDNEVYSNV